MFSQPAKIKIRTVSSGSAGNLSVVESSQDLPFSIKRVYYLHGLHENVSRGFHAHRTLHQCLVAVHGSLELRLEGPAGKFVFTLSSPGEGVVIPPGYWREMHEMSEDTVIMVLASADYDESDYIRDYGEFRAWLKSREIRGPVPYLDLGRPSVPLKEIEEALSRVLRSGRFINGPEVKAFETEFAAFLGVREVVGVGNGLDALAIILQALNVGPGDEVVVCAAGFVATALAVTRVGARPVFVDCRPGGNLDPARLEAAFGDRTRAVIPTHLYGLPADMEAIGAAAGKYGLPVIEDACQAHGVTLKGRQCGALGRAAAFSFYPTKNMGALGDGGCIATNDPALADLARRLANYGSVRKYHHDLLGCNSRLDELQAAVLRLKLKGLPRWNERRRHLAATYEQALAGLPGLVRPEAPPEAVPNWHVYAVRVKNGRRDELAAFLAEKGVGTNIHYPLALHQQGCYAAEYGGQSFPEAEAWAAETLSLPLDAAHSQAEIDAVCRLVREFFAEEGS